MREGASSKALTLGAAICLYPIILFCNGAVPGFLLPTAGQALWITAFAQSFARDLSIYAHNFGMPNPAAISFGLSMALPEAILIRAGLDPVVSYAVICAGWLAVAFWGSYSFARWIGAGRVASLSLGLVWCTLPIVWTHQSYSAVAYGIALLPTYLLFGLRLAKGETDRHTVAGFLIFSMVAVFMDGYTFMMMATGTSLALLCEMFRLRASMLSRWLSMAIVAAGLGIAYAAYAWYQGVADFGGIDVDFFRGWGANIEFFFTPTKGLLSFADLIGWGKDRSEQMYFGDASVYTSTFAGALIAVAGYAFFSGRLRRGQTAVLVAVVTIGFWLSLGPSVKLFTHRPDGVSQIMPAQYGLFPSGNAWLINLPGFQSMRAAYRWSALGIFGCWALIASMMASGRISMTARFWILAGLLMFNVPAISQMQSYRDYLNIAGGLRTEVGSWSSYFRKGETVVFLPYGNDFLANTIASDLDIQTYNIGGDKNQAAAQRAWPDEMNAFSFGQMGPGFAANVKALLDSGKADAVVFPYIDMLWAPHFWPVPDDQKADLEPIAHQIDDLPGYDVQYAQHFAVIRKTPAVN